MGSTIKSRHDGPEENRENTNDVILSVLAKDLASVGETRSFASTLRMTTSRVYY